MFLFIFSKVKSQLKINKNKNSETWKGRAKKSWSFKKKKEEPNNVEKEGLRSLLTSMPNPLYTFLSHFMLELGRNICVGLERKLMGCTTFSSPFLPNQTVENTYFLSTFHFPHLFLPLVSPNKMSLNAQMTSNLKLQIF